MAELVKQAHADLHEYHPLGRLRRIIRVFVLVEGVLLALVLGCLWFWFATALDYGMHYFFGVDLLDTNASFIRIFLLAAFAVAEISVLVWYIFTRLFRDFTAASLALVLEKRFPKLLGDRLITAVELADLKRAEKQGYSVNMIKKTMKDAKERVDQVPVMSVFNWRRLALLAWTLVGVSAFILLLTYPGCVLVSLAGQPRGESFWPVLLVNGLLVLALALVFLLPWLYAKRSSGVRRALLGLMAACVVGTGIGFYLAFDRINSMQLPEYSWRLYHVSNICLDRNLRFMETRWPRDEYFVDWLDFPVDEKRIQANETLGARAYFSTWIIADDAAPKHWRPVAWADLPNIVKEIPPLPLDRIQACLKGLMAGDERSPVGFNSATLKLPDEKTIPVDLAVALVLDPNAPDFSTDERQAFSNLADALNAKAADPKLGYRLIRRVEPPENVMLHYGSDGSKQKGFSKLIAQDERKNVYGLEQPVQLGDMFSVKRKTIDTTTPPELLQNDDVIVMRADAEVGGQTARTPSKLVALVRPPRVQLLVTQEFRPAYYYYLPPTAPRADTIDQRRRLLRDLRQMLLPVRTEYPSEAYPIPSFTLGSELDLTVQADKKLVEVTLAPRSTDFPGSAANEELHPLALPIGPDGKTFAMRFAQDGKPLRDWMNIWVTKGKTVPPVFPLITRPTTFDVVMKDTDNMTSTRTFTLNPLDDKLPNVNLYVDVIREFQASNRKVFLCTAKAEIPFTKESSISDDNGLHKVEFTYEYMPLANSAVVGVRAELAAWLWASSPLMPNIGDYLYRREVLLRTLSATKGPAPIKGTFPLDSFDNAQARFAQNQLYTLEQLQARVKKPLPDDYTSPFKNPFTFNEGDQPVTFDLQNRLPRLTEKDIASGVQPTYDLWLNVRATDSNVVADSDRTSENKDAALVFRIVPESQLQALIVREEAELVRRFEEMITRIESNQRILQQLVVRVPTLSVSTATSEQTRVEGITDVVAKAHELTGEVQNSYARILREYEVNRFDAKLTKGLSANIIEPLKAIQATEFTQAEQELIAFQVPLKEGRADLAQLQAGPTLLKMQNLLTALYAIKSKMGDTIAIKKILQDLEELIKSETEFKQKDLVKEEEKQKEKLFSIKISTPEKVELKAGETSKVKVTIRMPEAILADPFLRFEIPKDSGLKVNPAEVKLTDTATEASFEITAGKPTGAFSPKNYSVARKAG